MTQRMHISSSLLHLNITVCPIIPRLTKRDDQFSQFLYNLCEVIFCIKHSLLTNLQLTIKVYLTQLLVACHTFLNEARFMPEGDV